MPAISMRWPFLWYNISDMKNEKIILDIKKIYEKFVLKDAETFCVDDYNNFEEEIWALKERYQLEDSPFLLLPEPAEEADRKMMNASMDGMAEPPMDDKKQYLEKMKKSYLKL